MAVEFNLYKGFLIAVYSDTDVRAYRNRLNYSTNASSYDAPNRMYLDGYIDDANDKGDFTEKEYNEVMELLGRPKIVRYGAYSPEKTREIAVHMRDEPDTVAEAMYRYGMITEEEKAGFSQAVRVIATDWLVKFR